MTSIGATPVAWNERKRAENWPGKKSNKSMASIRDGHLRPPELLMRHPHTRHSPPTYQELQWGAHRAKTTNRIAIHSLLLPLMPKASSISQKGMNEAALACYRSSWPAHTTLKPKNNQTPNWHRGKKEKVNKSKEIFFDWTFLGRPVIFFFPSASASREDDDE